MKSRINRDEREISIRELWWYTLSKWKCLIAGFVVGALLLGGLQYFSEYKDEKQQVETDNKTVEELMADFTDKGKQQIQLAVDLYERYIEEYNNIDFNYVMTMDADRVNRALLQYRVDTDYIIDYNGITTENYTNDVLKMYASAVKTQEFRNNIMNLGLDNLKEEDLDYLVTVSYTGKILEFNIFGHDGDITKIAEVVKNTVDNSYEAITSGVGEHKIVFLNEDKSQVYSATIKGAQSTKRNNLKELQSSCDSVVNKMAEEQKSVYEILKNQIDYEYSSSEDSGEMVANERNWGTSVTKMVFIGGFVGVVLVLMILIFNYILSKKFRSINDVEQVYNVNLLGRIFEADSKKLEHYFERKRAQIVYNLKTEEQIAYVVDVIVQKCHNESVESLYIAYDAAINASTADQINKQLKENGINVQSGSSVIQSTEALNNAAKNKNIILVDRLDRSERALITEEIQVCDKLNINIVGMIVTI